MASKINKALGNYIKGQDFFAVLVDNEMMIFHMPTSEIRPCECFLWGTASIFIGQTFRLKYQDVDIILPGLRGLYSEMRTLNPHCIAK